MHFQHGPIDLVIEAVGGDEAVRTAYAAAWRRFETVLDELCRELPLLRMPVDRLPALPAGPVARRMVVAVLPYAARRFITPMAAVAGAVAEEILAAMAAAAPLHKAYVNNGGDIALHLAEGARFDMGIVDRPDAPRVAGTAKIDAASPIRGVATSGWAGRSFSLGIADAVTVLAATASAADAAATIVGNAVDLPDHPAVTRVPANSLQPDSDLGDRCVTAHVGALRDDEIDRALGRGRLMAERLIAERCIVAAALFLKGRSESAGPLTLPAAPTMRRKAHA
jgi:ApbE superfamily uncharacterized protein (UPF0280 family)